LGINASDINWTAGKYPPRPKLPFDAGFESIGTVVAKGSQVGDNIKIGDSVIITSYGAFAEYLVTDPKLVYPTPTPDPKFLSTVVSGLTASIALEQSGRMTSGETVLVTAAAGGTGMYAVQLAKLAGNHVIATVGSDDKAAVLKKMGVDRVINYKKEKLDEVLKKEYPKGVDIVYESVGGETFEACLNNLAVFGRLIVIGMVSGYQSGDAFRGGAGNPNVPAKILAKSASVIGFFLNSYHKLFKRHYQQLMTLIQEGKIESVTDSAKFKGLEQVADAIDYLYQGKNIGKVVVELIPSKPPQSKL